MLDRGNAIPPLKDVDVGSTHLSSTADYERMKQDRNKPKNRDEPRESILSLVIFGFYIAIAKNIQWQFKNRFASGFRTHSPALIFR